MNALMVILVAAIPRAFLAVVGSLLTDAFLQSVLKKVIVAGLKRAAKMTANTVDDAVVADIEQRFEQAQTQEVKP